MITAKYEFADPEKIPATMQITMTIAEWRKVEDALPKAYPFYDLGHKIATMIRKANDAAVERIDSEAAK